jgi:hypothetical protein
MSTRIWPTITDAVRHTEHVARRPLHWDPVDHLLSRFSYGPTPTARRYVSEHGPEAWYDAQVSAGHRLSGYRGRVAVANTGPLLTKTPKEVRAWLTRQGNEFGWAAMDQLTQVTLGLEAYSTAQLYETLVEFWSNHLNVPNHNGDVWITRHTYDRDVIRRHAMGSFTDMLLASAKHPAMLIYLNLAQSNKQLVNENYGREMLELHTVGLHYTERDVKNAARLLTGRQITSNFNYHYNPDDHYVGPIKVLNFHYHNGTTAGGTTGGDAMLRYLARHPDTAHHLALKICIRYVSDTPSAALVAAVARAYLDNDTEIMPMVHTILRSSEFWRSRGRKIRRPRENLIATIRTLDTKVAHWAQALNTLHWMTAAVGDAPLDWPAPNGYPDVAAAWRSSGSLLTLWNYHLGFSGDWWTGFAKRDKTTLYPHTPSTSGHAIELLTKRLTGMTFSASHRHTLQVFVGEPASTPIEESKLQWQLEPLIALILDSPHHALR